MTIISILSPQGTFAQTRETDGSSNSTNNVLDKIKISVANATKTTPFIGDSLTTSSSLSNATSEGKKEQMTLLIKKMNTWIILHQIHSLLEML
ncbi:hypothetical protein [Candidatus Nitrosocosmicus franklandus]|uniref:hypothetical protein n=1 Tax=Candidatus Nitrosocosmicus franklandianus TaxID=1798806 RepID=UPI0015595909|nr:hypothetical protein [Candidatus Nitrosocosmicus franklandus]